MPARWIPSLLAGIGIGTGIVIGCGAVFMLASAAPGYYHRMQDEPKPAPEAVSVAAAVPASPPALLTAAVDAIPIVVYHDIVSGGQTGSAITSEAFALQMSTLALAGAHPIGLQDLYDHLNSNKPIPDHAVVLTFDGATPGQFINALPLLTKYHFPAVFFLPTELMSDPTAQNTVSWSLAQQAEEMGLVTFAAQAPDAALLAKLTPAELTGTLQNARLTLETHLKHPLRFLAYTGAPVNFDIARAARDAGWLAAVTQERGWAACPAQSGFLPRLTPDHLPEIAAVWQGRGMTEPPLPRTIAINSAPLERGTYVSGQYAVQWIAGGDLASQALHTRRTVGEMAWDAKAQAALNGTFFADARIYSRGSAMLGPTLCRFDNTYNAALTEEDPHLEGRPLILAGKGRCVVLPYAPHLGHSREVLLDIMPEVTDAFLAGGWIVHNGQAAAPELITAWSAKDADDARHRAFAGIDSQHRFVLGAVQESIGSIALSKILADMKMEEAWLMDSGFSTSLIWQNHVLVSGHAHKDIPSRPVPHALFLCGTPAANALPAPTDAPVAAGPGGFTTEDALLADGGSPHGTPRLRHHRHRRA